MKKILLTIASLSLLITSLSIAYYFVIFLPHAENTQKIYTTEIKKLQRENSAINNRIENIQNNASSPATNTEDIQNTVQNVLDKELQNQANCERLGGRYQGGGTCAYY